MASVSSNFTSLLHTMRNPCNAWRMLHLYYWRSKEEHVRSFAKHSSVLRDVTTRLRRLFPFLPCVRLVRIVNDIGISNRAFVLFSRVPRTPAIPTTLAGCNFPSHLGSAWLLSLRRPFYREGRNGQEFFGWTIVDRRYRKRAVANETNFPKRRVARKK
jgi:hypothetical protein